MSDLLTDVRNIIARNRTNFHVSDEQLAQQVLDTAALPRPRKKGLKLTTTAEDKPTHD